MGLFENKFVRKTAGFKANKLTWELRNVRYHLSLSSIVRVIKPKRFGWNTEQRQDETDEHKY
jgi:hypothetical protein